MQRSFTLLELIVVIIIIGILATLGFSQYTRMVEKSKGAEARSVCGSIRTIAAGYWMQNGSLAGFGNAQAGIGPGIDQIPGPTAADCRSSHYFNYRVFSAVGDQLLLVAVRCLANGKNPQGPAGLTYFLNFTADFNTGVCSWVSNYPY